MRLFVQIWVHYEMLAFKKFVMLDFPTLKSLLFSFFVKYDEGYRKNEWGFHFGSFFVLRRFSSWWQHFLLSAKAHYNFVPNKEGSRRRDSLVFPYCCMLAIFWVQSWWLGNTPENQDESSRKKWSYFRHIFLNRLYFSFAYFHISGEIFSYAKKMKSTK